MMGYGFSFGGILTVVFWVAIITVTVTGIWLLIGSFRRYNRERSSQLETARRRYAAGEITRDEFDRIKHDLTGA